MIFLGKGFHKLEHNRQTDTQTDATANTTTSYLRVVNNNVTRNNRCSCVRSFSTDVTDSVLLWLQDPDASYDFNDKDNDPFPRYDATGENKYSQLELLSSNT